MEAEEQKRHNIGQSRSFEGLIDKVDQDIAIGGSTKLLRNTRDLNLTSILPHQKE